MTVIKKEMRAGWLILAAVVIVSMGCLAMGRPFPITAVSMIKTGETTEADISRLFGPPWRTGIEDGDRTWTYAYYRYTVPNGAQTRDLIVRFDKNGIVSSYTFSSSYPEDQ